MLACRERGKAPVAAVGDHVAHERQVVQAGGEQFAPRRHIVRPNGSTRTARGRPRYSIKMLRFAPIVRPPRPPAL